MIVDSSAIVAIVKSESQAKRCVKALELASSVSISAANFLEASIVIDSMDAPVAVMTFEIVMNRYGITIEPVTETQSRIARLAYRRFGKGNDERARLNFGDCFAYALARDRNEPLLFVGSDFIHTDIRLALAG